MVDKVIRYSGTAADCVILPSYGVSRACAAHEQETFRATFFWTLEGWLSYCPGKSEAP